VAQQLTEIPADAVGRVVQDFVDDGFVTIIVERQNDGTYTLTAQ
jgi:hypothetical protein